MALEQLGTATHERRDGLAPAAPAVAALGCVAAGLLLARACWRWDAMAPTWVWAVIALVGIGGVLASHATRRPLDRVRAIGLALVAVALAAGWWQHRVIEPGRVGLGSYLPGATEPALFEIEGVVVEGGRDVEPAGAMAAFVPFAGARHVATVRVERIGGEAWASPGADRLRVSIGGSAEHAPLTPGERVSLLGYVRRLRAPMNPGQRDARPNAWLERVAGELRVESWGVVDRLGDSPAWIDRARAWRWRLQARARRLLPEGSRGGALLAELLLGARDDRGVEAEATRGAFRRVGLAHLLAISGFHLVALAALVSTLCRVIPGAGRYRAIAVVLVVLAYIVLLPARPPVLRAGWMLIAWFGARAAGRRYHPLAVLSWAAIAMLLWRPTDLWDAGFQLSVAMTAALITLTERAHARVWGPIALRRLLRGARAHESESLPRAVLGRLVERVRALTTVSLLCWSVAIPIAAHWFGQVSPVAVLATLIVAPMLVPLLWLGYLVVLVGLVAPGAVGWAQGLLEWLGGVIASVVAWMDGLPMSSVRTPTLSAIWAIAGASVVAMWWWSRRAASLGALAPIAVVLLWGGIEAQVRPRLAPGVALRIDTLSVGDGTCHVVRARGGGVVMWDCGSLWPGHGRRAIPEACRALGVWRVPTVVLSHPNFDHYSALLDAAPMLGVERVYVGRSFVDRALDRIGGPTAALLDEMRARGIEVRQLEAGDALRLGDGVIEILGPAAELRGADANDQSLIALVRTGGAPGVLLTGDAQERGIGSLMSRVRLAEVDVGVLEAPHHGSHNSTAESLIDATDPAVVLQSTGPRRLGDDRWDRQRASRRWLTTAEVGAAWAEVMGDGRVRAGAIRRERDR